MERQQLVKEAKQRFEKKLDVLLDEFEKETGVNVHSIEISKTEIQIDNAASFRLSRKSILKVTV